MEELSSAERYQYERMVKFYKKELKIAKEDLRLTEQDRKARIAIINEQLKSLKRDFVKRLEPKVKYSRAKKKQSDLEETSRYFEGKED